MKPGIIIQARIGSSRLPQKVINPFWQQKNIIEILVEKLKPLHIPIILATSDSAENSILKKFSDKYSIGFFQGSEKDVLKRFIDASDIFKLDVIIRVCADNPFLYPPYIKLLFESYKKGAAEYLSFMTKNGTPSIQTHFGFFAELVERKALLKIINENPATIYREHVTNYIYNFPEKFNIKWLEFPFKEPSYGARFTIDTLEDFNLMSSIYAEYNEMPPGDLIARVGQNKSALDTMENQIILNSK